jgi:hypothetical protein
LFAGGKLSFYPGLFGQDIRPGKRSDGRMTEEHGQVLWSFPVDVIPILDSVW